MVQVMEPRYVAICLFTCASTHTVRVHLKHTHGMSVDAFIIAFRRFVGQRGSPVILHFDNAKSFKSSSKTYSQFVICQKCFIA